MKKRIGVTIISLPGGLEMLMWFCIACPKIDQQPQLRTEKEQARLQTDATDYWNSLRWGIPQRASLFIEDPLERARFAANQSAGQLMDVKVLGARLDPQPEKGAELAISSAGSEIWQTATVVVRIEAIESDHILRVREENQDWYRTEKGWFVNLSETSIKAPESPQPSQDETSTTPAEDSASSPAPSSEPAPKD